MSKKVLKDILESFDVPDSSRKAQTRPTKQTLEAKALLEAEKQKKQRQKTLEIYKRLRKSHPSQTVNLSNLKRKFFKHNPDKSQINTSKNQKPQKSVFTDKDFENLIPK